MFENVEKFVRELLTIEEPLTKVLKVTSENFESRPVLKQEDFITLYGPKTPADSNSSDRYYEIVLRKPFTESWRKYSLFRSKEKEVAEEKFALFKDKVLLYLNVTKECKTESLQKLCDLLSEHPSWSIAHVVAQFGHQEFLKDPEVQKHIDDIDPATGITPLMVAVKSHNLKLVQKLLSLNCSLDTVDCDGNTVFHYAATSNKEIIHALAKKKSTALNVLNKQGYTPFQLACLANAPDCVRALIMVGSDVNLTAGSVSSSPALAGEVLEDNKPKLHQEDMKNGGTPLHWVKFREVIDALVDKNCNINALNFDGRTALHVMVIRGRLECAAALLSRGAELNIKDKEGNTPLHLAVKQSSVAIVQALIVFGADIEAVNNAGHTARHLVPIDMANSNFDKILYVLHAIGAKRCSPEMHGCRAGCSNRGDYNGMPPPPIPAQASPDFIYHMLSVAAKENKSSKKKGRLLCLDGGGIRGLVLVQLLLKIEEAVGESVINCFEWVAGTSTGGILALALACGKTLRECQSLYFRMKDLAFVGGRPYPSEALENILKECLGTERVMTDIQHPKLMILASLADRKPVDLHIFRNYQSAQDIADQQKAAASFPTEKGDIVSIVPLPAPPPPSEQLVWQAARASGAAPSYFRAFGRYLDGGLIGNNPTLDALTELAELKLALRHTGQKKEAEETELKVVVSCGTGLTPVKEQSDIDIFMPESILDVSKLANGLSAIGTLLVDQATCSDGRVVERARSWCSTIGIPYYRFSPQMSKNVDMDEKSDQELVNMLWETEVYMRVNRDRVRELAQLLKN